MSVGAGHGVSAPRCWKQDAAAAGAMNAGKGGRTIAPEWKMPGARVSMLGSTDMPARSPAAAGLVELMRTGMRCTILVKLPVALSGGSSANSSPLAGDDAVDMARERGAWQAIHQRA